MSEHNQSRWLKPYLWLITFIGLIVPRRLRSDWKHEWEGELEHREALLIAIGVAVGLAGGAPISGLLAGVLVDISQFDPLAFCMVAAFLTVVALSACYVPARRATKVDPMAALRHD
jgi:hypothetical protein